MNGNANVHTVRKFRLPRARLGALAAAALMTGTAVTAYAPAAHADDVSPTGKGIVGGALLGAEVVTITESVAGVRSGWAYLLGGGLGAVGGGVGGYFVEQSVSDGHIPTYMLAGGLALVIPALVLTLNATRYMPTAGATEDRAPTNVPPAEPGKAGGSAVIGTEPAATPPATPPATTPPTTPAPAPAPAPAPTPGGGGAPLSLFDLAVDPALQSPTSFRLGLPVPEVRPAFSLAEQKAFGVAQVSEVRLPVLHVSF